MCVRVYWSILRAPQEHEHFKEITQAFKNSVVKKNLASWHTWFSCYGSHLTDKAHLSQGIAVAYPRLLPHSISDNFKYIFTFYMLW